MYTKIIIKTLILLILTENSISEINKEVLDRRG